MPRNYGWIVVAAGALKRINVYETFVEGAKEGFHTAINIAPYLVAMLVAIGVFRASGALDLRRRSQERPCPS